MNGGFVMGPKCVQEVCLEVNVNRNMSRLPVIIIQTPAEVEAGLFSNCSSDENPQIPNNPSSTDDKNDLNLISWKRKPEIRDYQEVAESRSIAGLSTLDRSRNTRACRFTRNTNANIEFQNEWRVRVAARKGRWSRNMAKKSTANEQKSVVEDALFAFKKMRLHCDEIDDHTMD